MLTRNLEGWLSSVRRESTGFNQKCAIQIPTGERYQGCVRIEHDLFLESGMHHYDGIVFTPTNIINSSILLPSFFMTHLLLREYLMISWSSPLSKGMSQQDHSLSWFKVRLPDTRLMTFG